MEITFSNEITGDKQVVFKRSFWTGKNEITFDGVRLRKSGKNQFQKGNGEEAEFIIVQGNEIKGIDLIFGEGTVTVLRKLNALEWILAMIPLVMVIIGGAVGGALGGLGTATLLLILRKVNNVFLKILFALLISALVFILWFIIALSILQSIPNPYY